MSEESPFPDLEGALEAPKVTGGGSSLSFGFMLVIILFAMILLYIIFNVPSKPTFTDKYLSN